MQQGSSARPGRQWVAIALAALLALTVAIPATSAGATGPGKAFEAKKCKKKKKKRCKKKRHVLSIPGPLVRATISWPAGDVDLHAFDASGNRSGIAFPCTSLPCPISEGIPSATHSVDSENGGSETFTDLIFVQNGLTNREFAYAVCFFTSTTVTFTGVNRFGQSQSLPITDGPGGGHSLTAAGGPQVPPGFSCLPGA